MKLHEKMVVLMFTLYFLIVVSYRSAAQQKLPKNYTIDGFAVLELFTSEGCSSCPPAEALLEKINTISAGKPVYVLCFHVDYWDRLGWKDAFSDHRFSQRQYQYSHLLSGQVYTPQLVINGSAEGVGSDVDFVHTGIDQALSAKPRSGLDVTYSQDHQSGVLHYTILGEPDNVRLVVAFVQKHAISHVLRGENKGRTLSHAAIVRDLRVFSISQQKTGRISLKLPQDFDPSSWDIVSFLQNPLTGVIDAASRAHVIRNN